LKIIHITASYKPAYVYGGPIQSIGKLCEAIVDFNVKNANIEVLTTNANGKTELDVNEKKQLLIDRVPVTYFKRITKDHTHFSPSLLQHLRSMIRQAKYDNQLIIIHIHAWWNLVSILSCFVAKWYRIPVVLSPRGMLTGYTQNNRNTISKQIIHHILGKNLLKYCHLHATSKQEQQDILNIVQPKSMTVISNLVDFGTPFNINHTTSEKNIFKLVFLSRIEQKKGLELLFDALAILKISWKLSIAGSGESDYIESLKLKARNLKLDQQIEWLGHVSNDEKFKLLANHDLMVLPSYNENFANVVVESLSVGTAVLVSQPVGLSSYVADQKLGWVSRLNTADIALQITNAFEKVELRAKIRTEAPLLIREDFDSKILVEQYLKLYDEVMREFEGKYGKAKNN
jgi:glycosyltransferase involved in cell wall biosynthesis